MKKTKRGWLSAAWTVMRTPAFVFGAGATVGILYFLIIYGFTTIDPSNVAWIHSREGDVFQHYTGWYFYRESEWTFPIGMISDLAYPFGVPVTFMDAIPLFAIVFKVLSPLLSEQFQYLGLFTLLSFALQGGIGALIIRKFTDNTLLTTIAAGIFVISPVLIERAFSHTALTAQWVVLLAIYMLIVYIKDRRHLNWRFLAIWSGIMSLAVLIHPYFLPMTLALYAICLVQCANLRPVVKLLRFLIPPLAAILVFWSIGGLTPTSHGVDRLGLDVYSLNLASPVDPFDMSTFMKHQPFADQREGIPETGEKMNYLGLGVILMIFTLAVWWVIKIGQMKPGQFRRRLRKLWTWRNITTAAIVLGVILISLGPVVKFGSIVLVTWPVPEIIEKILLVFRSSGRMFWPIYYLIVTGAIVLFIRSLKQSKLPASIIVILFATFAIIQLVDISPSPGVKSRRALIISHYDGQYEISPLARAIIDRHCDKQHLISLSRYIYHEEFVAVSEAVMNCKMTVTEGYYSHDYKRWDIDKFTESERRKLIEGTANMSENLYVTTDKDFIAKIKNNYTIEAVENWYIISAKQ